MSSLDKKEPDENPPAADAVALLQYYFELGDAHAETLREEWLKRYPAPWIRLAIIESLYQGRYKAISVSQILEVWHRRQQVLQHFNYDFECLVGNNLPSNSPEIAEPSPELAIPTNTDAAETAIVEEQEETPPSISQFTPDTDRSEFYTRLQAIVQRAREKPEQETSQQVSEVKPPEEITSMEEGKISGE